ncbi:MAG: transglutaminase-like domain-containing protein [Nanoarchaeota archaeon]|nr:transglutaminase-like domain-containing protein [Nanoarchaeota archaeon]
MKLHYKNPQKVRGSYIWKADTKFLSEEDLKSKLKSDLNDKNLLDKLVKKYGNKLFLASGSRKKDEFFVWFSRIKQWANQKNVKTKFSIEPKKSNKDKENENVIDFFDFSNKLNKKFQLKIDFSFDCHETILEVNSNKTKPYNKNSKLYQQYTKSEKYLEQTKEITKLAKSIVGEESNFFKQARKLFDWIIENINYKYPPEIRGVIPTLKNKCGDCGEFNHVFIALCRILGIPARSVLGMWAIPKEKQGYHAWAEFYLEGVGWIPVDSSVAEGLKNKKDKEFVKFMKKIKNPMNYEFYFGNLDNNRIIFSKGENILIPNCPKELSQFPAMEDCKSSFMQPTSIYPHVSGNKKGIFIIDIEAELDVLARTHNYR